MASSTSPLVHQFQYVTQIGGADNECALYKLSRSSCAFRIESRNEYLVNDSILLFFSFFLSFSVIRYALLHVRDLDVETGSLHIL